LRYQSTALQISVGVHAVIIATILGMSTLFVSQKKPLIIDFTLEDSLSVPERGPSGATPERGGRDLSTVIQNRKGEVKRPETEEVKEPEPKPAEQPQMRKLSPAVVDQTPQMETQAPVAMPSGHSVEIDKNAGQSSGRTEAVSSLRAVGGGGAGGPGGGGTSGSGSGGPGRKAGYSKESFYYIVALVHSRLTYPKIAEEQGWEGRVVLSFVVLSNGNVRDIEVVKSSGRGILDKNAIDAVRDAAPFPRPPAEGQLILPVVYRLLRD